MTKGLIIFDNTGKIYNQSFGDVDRPDSIHYMEVDVPEGTYINHVDVSDPENPKVVFVEDLSMNVGRLRKNIAAVSQQLRDTTDELTLTQLAIAEMYESALMVNEAATETTEQEV